MGAAYTGIYGEIGMNEPKIPRGIRNNNPGNIELSRDVWVGQAEHQTDGRFIQFNEPVYGIRALMKVLLNYQKLHKLKTIRRMIHRWAPPHENKSVDYSLFVAQRMGIGVAVPFSFDRKKLIHMAEAITRFENGENKDGLPYWYSPIIFGQAADMALGLKDT